VGSVQTLKTFCLEHFRYNNSIIKQNHTIVILQFIPYGQLEDRCSLFWQYLPTFFDQIFIDGHISTTQHDIVSILENNIEYGVKIDYKSLKNIYLPLVDNREQVKWKFISTRISEKLNILHYAATF
jgi:hypothetical protein